MNTDTITAKLRTSTIAVALMTSATLAMIPSVAKSQHAHGNTPITGVDAIPTDIPVHASTVRDPNLPVSLLPGTIPAATTPTFEEDIPSLAEIYHQTINGGAPRTTRQQSAPRQPDVPSTPETSNAAQSTKSTRSLAGQTLTKQVAATTSPSVQASQPTANTQALANGVPDEATGPYVIQLGAFHDTISAQTYWARFSIRYPDLVKAHPREIATADLGSKGVFHRLRLAGFPNQSSANEKCRQLIADGTECFAIRP